MSTLARSPSGLLVLGVGCSSTRRRLPVQRHGIRAEGIDVICAFVKAPDYGGTDAEPRWVHPRWISRLGQRGAHSSGWLVA